PPYSDGLYHAAETFQIFMDDFVNRSAQREADRKQDPAFDAAAIVTMGRDEAPSLAHGVEGGLIEVIEAGGFRYLHLLDRAIGGDQHVKHDGTLLQPPA